MSLDFLKNILIYPTVSNFEIYLLNLIVLLIIFNIIAYFTTIFIIQTPIYRSKKEFIDIDLRKKYCWSISYAFTTFCVTGNIVYIWLKVYYSGSVDFLPHWSMLIIILIIWGIIQLSIKKDLSSSRKVIPV